MKTRNVCLLCAVMLIVAAGVALTGCESTGTTDSAITITGTSSNITGKAAVTLTASLAGGTNSTTSLALPLVWTVSDASLGDIKSSAGVTAIYQSTGKVGNNAVTVRDQGDAEGVAVVSQQ